MSLRLLQGRREARRVGVLYTTAQPAVRAAAEGGGCVGRPRHRRHSGALGAPRHGRPVPRDGYRFQSGRSPTQAHVQVQGPHVLMMVPLVHSSVPLIPISGMSRPPNFLHSRLAFRAAGETCAALPTRLHQEADTARHLAFTMANPGAAGPPWVIVSNTHRVTSPYPASLNSDPVEAVSAKLFLPGMIKDQRVASPGGVVTPEVDEIEL